MTKVKNKLEATIDAVDYSECPELLRAGFERWLRYGLLPGGFLTAVLKNDLLEAFNRADILNRRLMFAIVFWVVNNMPEGSYGSVEAVHKWTEIRRLKREKGT